jgi:type I restriction enzyme, R subunit
MSMRMRDIATIFSQADLERKTAARAHRRDPATVPIDRSIAGGGGRSYQIGCIETLTQEISAQAERIADAAQASLMHSLLGDRR